MFFVKINSLEERAPRCVAPGTGQRDAGAGLGCFVLLRCSREDPKAKSDKLTTGFRYWVNMVLGDAEPRGAARSLLADVGVQHLQCDAHRLPWGFAKGGRSRDTG